MSCIHHFELSYVELYNPAKHGFIEGISDPCIHGQFLVYEDIQLSEWLLKPKELSNADIIVSSNQLNWDAQDGQIKWIKLRNKFVYCCPPVSSNYGMQLFPDVRNFNNLQFLRKIQAGLQIVKKIYMEGDEEVAILKTFWLRIFQRKWRSIYNKRQSLIKSRMKTSSLIERETTGHWPKGLRVM
tara:strand:- start:4037 stop:4588 length:552 start_codon:yes stop_codon:yes gene_type:complete